MVTEMIRADLGTAAQTHLTEAESTLLALGIHADTGAAGLYLLDQTLPLVVHQSHV